MTEIKIKPNEVALNSAITFFASQGAEVLRIAKDGFYVRGIKLEQDESEARRLFDALEEWLRSQPGYQYPKQ